MSKYVCIFAFLFSIFGYSSAPSCTGWVARDGISCADNYGKWGKSWRRQCLEFACQDLDPYPNRVIFAYGCNKEDVCASVDPNKIKKCSDWKKERGVNCASHTGDFEQKWSRICVNGGIGESFCSDDINPNTLSGSCTKWVRVSGETCQSHSGDWEDKWQRQCVDNVYKNTEFCSDRINPNDLNN